MSLEYATWLRSITPSPIKAAAIAMPAAASTTGNTRAKMPIGTIARMIEAIKLLFVCVFILLVSFADGRTIAHISYNLKYL